MTDLLLLKKLTKGSCIVCNSLEYLREAKKLSEKNVYKEGQYKKQMLSNLIDTINRIFRCLKIRGFIAGKLKCFAYEFMNSSSSSPDISNCGMPTEKASRFLDYNFKPIMQNGNSYIRDSGQFIERIRNINNLPENARLVTTDMVDLYPSRFECTQRNSWE